MLLYWQRWILWPNLLCKLKEAGGGGKGWIGGGEGWHWWEHPQAWVPWKTTAFVTLCVCMVGWYLRTCLTDVLLSSQCLSVPTEPWDGRLGCGAAAINAHQVLGKEGGVLLFSHSKVSVSKRNTIKYIWSCYFLKFFILFIVRWSKVWSESSFSHDNVVVLTPLSLLLSYTSGTIEKNWPSGLDAK